MAGLGDIKLPIEGKVLFGADGEVLSKAEDTAHASGEHGLLVLAVRKDTAIALAGTDGDYIPLIVDANGRLHVVLPTTATIGKVTPLATDGSDLFAVPPQLDDTDKQAVSIYGKGTNPGDTPVDVVAGSGMRVVVKGETEALTDADAAAGRYLNDANNGSIRIPARLWGCNPSLTWDRLRTIAASGAGLGVLQVGTLGELITLAASAARTASANGTAVTGLGWRNRYIILLDLTAAATAVDDTLDVYVDVSLDGTTWINAVHFTQMLGNGSAKQYIAVLDPSSPGTSTIVVTTDATEGVVRPSLFGPQMRARWAIVDSGTDDASFTFSVAAYAI